MLMSMLLLFQLRFVTDLQATNPPSPSPIVSIQDPPIHGEPAFLFSAISLLRRNEFPTRHPRPHGHNLRIALSKVRLIAQSIHVKHLCEQRFLVRPASHPPNLLAANPLRERKQEMHKIDARLVEGEHLSRPIDLQPVGLLDRRADLAGRFVATARDIEDFARHTLSRTGCDRDVRGRDVIAVRAMHDAPGDGREREFREAGVFGLLCEREDRPIVRPRAAVEGRRAREHGVELFTVRKYRQGVLHAHRHLRRSLERRLFRVRLQAWVPVERCRPVVLASAGEDHQRPCLRPLELAASGCYGLE